MLKKLYFFTAILTIVIITSCIRDRETIWETRLKAPVAKSTLSIENILGSDYIKNQGDTTLSLVFKQNLSEINTDSIIKYSDTTITFGASLQTLDLEDLSFSYTITIEELLLQAGFNQSLLNIFFSNPIPVNIPGNTLNDALSNIIENSTLFQSVDIESGVVELEVINNLPVDITNIDFSINNAVPSNTDLLYSKVIPLIAKNTIYTDVAVLDDKTIYSSLKININSMNIVGATGVILNRNQKITANIKVKNVKPRKATAVWPAQDIIDTTTLGTLDNTNSGVSIKEMIVKTGEVYVEALSSLEDTLYLTYEVPHLISNFGTGSSLVLTAKIPPSQNGEYGKITKVIDFSDYLFKLNGFGIDGNVPDTVNVFYQRIRGRIEYTGQMKTLSKEDTLLIVAGIRNVVPQKVLGYFGNSVQKIGPDELELDVFDKVKSGKLFLEDVKMSVTLNNGIGASAKAKINKLQSIDKAGNVVDLNVQNSGEFTVNKAIDKNTMDFNDPVIFSANQHVLNKANTPNITDFVSNFPKKIRYEMEFELNEGLPEPSVQTIVNNPPNFLYDDKFLNGDLEVEIPLHFLADSLVLIDTLDFTYNASINEDIKKGNFGLVVKNSFPFNAFITLVTLDNSGNILDTILVKGSILKAETNVNGKVSNAVKSFIPVQLDLAGIDNLQFANRIIATIGFHTGDSNNPELKKHKIYSDYKLDVVLTAQLSLQIKN